MFLRIILRWWKVINIKDLAKLLRWNDSHYKAISSVSDEKYMFLKNFISWLVRWDDLEVQGEVTINAKRSGELKM